MEAMIQRVDEERYNSGRPAPNFRVNRKEHPEMRLYDYNIFERTDVRFTIVAVPVL